MPHPVSSRSPALLVAQDWHDYELLDTGNGMKLERCSSIATA